MANLTDLVTKMDPTFSKLTPALRAATGTPNDTDYAKDKTSFNDILDCFLQLLLVPTEEGIVPFDRFYGVLYKRSSQNINSNSNQDQWQNYMTHTSDSRSNQRVIHKIICYCAPHCSHYH